MQNTPNQAQQRTPQRSGQQENNRPYRIRVNSINIAGNVGQTPKLFVKGDTIVARFSLAVDKSYTNKNGEFVEQTNWFEVVAFGSTAELVKNYVYTGQTLLIMEGVLNDGMYFNDNGEKRYRPHIVANKIIFLSRKTKEEKMEERNSQNRQENYQQGQNEQDGFTADGIDLENNYDESIF